MSWIGDILEGLSRAWERATVRSEQDRIAAARARAVYQLRVAEQEHYRAQSARVAAEQEAAAAAAKVDAARAAAVQAAEAADLYETAEAERAASAADGSEP